MEVKEERFKMKALILLYLMGLGYKVSVCGENSTKVLYAVLTVESSAINNFTSVLRSFLMSSPVVVKDVGVTTKCSALNNKTECQCMEHYKWNDEVCTSFPECCPNEKCTMQSVPSSQLCHPTARVEIFGSFLMANRGYNKDLDDSETPLYKDTRQNILNDMLPVYSTFPKFVSLTITGFKPGSLIVYFQLILNSNISSLNLANKTSQLQCLLDGEAQVETKGMVEMTAPTGPVNFKSKQSLFCSTKEDMILYNWQLKNIVHTERIFNVTNGFESTIDNSSQKTTLNLTLVSGVWSGLFSCLFRTSSLNLTIIHKASAVLDVALLPQVMISSNPQFPQCTDGSGYKDIQVLCEIKNSTETYNISWKCDLKYSDPGKPSASPYGSIIYTLNTKVDCSNTSHTPRCECTFTNRLNESKKTEVEIYVIYMDDPFCKEENIWPVAKSGHVATMKCKNGVGERSRSCNNSIWGLESSTCVNVDLHDILLDAQNLRRGLGTVEQNTPDIFNRLKHSTNNTEAINSFANVNASVIILQTMQNLTTDKLNQLVLNDLIESSSNLLDISLNKSWISKEGNKNDPNLASLYLESVEGLITKTDIKMNSGRISKPNIELVSCMQNCNGTVSLFNVNVSLDGGKGQTKTVVFKFLNEVLLPQKNDSSPNSLVVSAIVQDNVKTISIDFDLRDDRQPNVKMYCVFWDFKADTWSTENCTWGGSDNERHCECTHLSSFTILMAKKPITLDYMDEITYVSLGVSIASLVLCLGIEILVWHSVVKSSIAFFRHTTHVNICLCLLIAHITFLASAFPDNISDSWCQICVVLKHFYYLAMFFWMLCLSIILLHQITFTFHKLSKNVFLGSSFFLGYFCPLVIVAFTMISYNNGQENIYYSSKTCWLLYKGLFKGSMYAFVLPVGTIVIINVFCMLVVVMKLLNPAMAEHSNRDEKQVSKGILKAVILLTPILGTTWFLGFFVLTIDLTKGPLAYFVNYAFTLLNGFQGFFILLATYAADKAIREALLKRLGWSRSQSTTSASSSKLSSMKSH
ncbi:adhesion G protein-coupled receptor F4 isoform X3 [Osmerus eperlanus]|uniref:adhesion G protein-coupled receptor F4 isoform X3 n=1 Tax=Osmerus eperlanus TaxID=29151 RepID=UPI002E16600A